MDPITCCLLGICCPPATVVEQEARIAKMLLDRGIVNDRDNANSVAAFLVQEVERLKGFMKERS